MIINLTGHAVRVKLPTKKIKTIKSSGILRLGYSTVSKGEIDGLPITESYFGSGGIAVPRKDGTIYIVSKIVCEAYKDRDDFYIVNQKGRANHKVYCESLSRNPYYIE